MAKTATPVAPPTPQEPAEPLFGRVPIDQIDVPEEHQRPLGEIEELAQTIAQEGLLQPIIVRQRGDRFELMAGWRRYNAVKSLGWREIPAQVRDADDTTRRVVRTVENVQRMQLDPVQEAQEYARLQGDGLEVHQVARRVGRSPLHVTNRLMLLSLPEAMQSEVGVLGGLTIGDAVELARISEHPEHLQAAHKAVKGGTPAGNAVQLQLNKLAKLTQVAQVKKTIRDRGDVVFEGSIGSDGFAVSTDHPFPGMLFWPYEKDAEAFQYGVSPEADEFPVCVNPGLHLNDSDQRVRESAQALVTIQEKGSMEAPATPQTEDEAAKARDSAERKHWKEMRRRDELREVALTKVVRGGLKKGDDELIARGFVASLAPDQRDAVYVRCNVARIEATPEQGFGERWDLESYLGGRGSWEKLARAAALQLMENQIDGHVKAKTRLLHGVEADTAREYFEYLEGGGYALSPQECELAGIERDEKPAAGPANDDDE